MACFLDDEYVKKIDNTVQEMNVNLYLFDNHNVSCQKRSSNEC